jgi:hypothetical protein
MRDWEERGIEMFLFAWEELFRLVGVGAGVGAVTNAGTGAGFGAAFGAVTGGS